MGYHTKFHHFLSIVICLRLGRFSSGIILCGRLGSKHQISNYEGYSHNDEISGQNYFSRNDTSLDGIVGIKNFRVGLPQCSTASLKRRPVCVCVCGGGGDQVRTFHREYCSKVLCRMGRTFVDGRLLWPAGKRAC